MRSPVGYEFGGRRRRAVAAVLVLTALLGAAVGPVAAGTRRSQPDELPPVSAECPRLVVPMYFDPSPAWDEVIAAAPRVEYMILNLNSGPGDAPNAESQRLVGEAQAAGIKVLGYIYTALAERDLDELKAEIRQYRDWYGVDGIHIDGAEDDPEFVPYYRELARAVRLAGRDNRPGIVWLNPGYVPAEEFMEFVDIVETFEWFYDKYPAQEFPAWIDDYPAERFAHVVTETPSDPSAMAEMLALARERNAGFVYVTDRTVADNEYLGLPSYWSEMVEQVCS